MKSEEYKVLLHSTAEHDAVNIGTHQRDDVSEKLTASIVSGVLQISGCLYVQDKPVDNNVKCVTPQKTETSLAMWREPRTSTQQSEAQ